MKQGWEIKKLGEVCEIKNGRNQSDVVNPDGQYPIYGSGGIMGYADDYICNEGCTIIGRKGSINNPIYVTTKFWNVDTAFGFSPLAELDGRFLYYFCLGFNFKNLDKGTTLPSLTKTDLSLIEIPFPPLTEQHRIVKILDKLFTDVEKAKAIAEQNLKNAKELFNSYLQGVFEKKGDGWEEKTLKELTTKIGSGATPHGGQESYKSEGISLVRSMNVYDWEFRDTNLAFIDEKQAKELDGVTLQENDVLLNITGASVARCCVLPKEYLPARVNQHVSIIRPKKELLDASFINLLLTSKPYKDQLLYTGEQGATRQALTKAQIEAFRISIPSLKEQQNIVCQIDALRAETLKLEAVYQKKKDDLEELKKSILQKAFNGEI